MKTHSILFWIHDYEAMLLRSYVYFFFTDMKDYSVLYGDTVMAQFARMKEPGKILHTVRYVVDDFGMSTNGVHLIRARRSHKFAQKDMVA